MLNTLMPSPAALRDVPPHVPPELCVDFNVYAPPGADRDFHASWLPLQADDVPAILWSVHNGGHWLPTRGALVAAIYADHLRFSNRYSMVPKDVAAQFFGIPQSLDPPDHQPFRMLLASVLGPKAINRVAEDVRARARRMVAEIRPRGECDFVRDYADVLPVQVFMSLVDLPPQDAPHLQALNAHIVRPSAEGMSVLDADRALADYLAVPVAARLGGEGSDMLSRMINGWVNGRTLSETEALNLTKLVMQGGLDTVSNLLSFALHHLATNPDHRRALVEDPALIPAAIDEMIRRFPVASTGRMVRRNMVYEGVDMRAGDAVMLATPIHGLDHRENEDPMLVDFHRSARAYSTFGQGVHRCPGAYLARLEIETTLREWLSSIPEFELAQERTLFRGGIIATVEALPLRWTA